MKKKNAIIRFEGIRIRNGKPITKVGFDSGVLVALIDNDKEYNLKRPEFFIRKGICFVYQLVVNQTIGVLFYKRNYPKEKAIDETLKYLQENNIFIIKEEEINIEKRNSIFESLKQERNKIKVVPKPEDSDLDILASYKVMGIDCIITTNYKHFIELGGYLEIYVEKIETEKQKVRRENEKMMRDFFWKSKRFK